MTKRGIITGLAAVAALCAVATFTSHSARAEDDKAGWKDITLVYHSDVKGKIDPCG
ncbi:MAG TPA: hypothetical protein PLQ13_00290 [Candidatus Krumholzibacteria bacterium]|nr:hypothetical protein [Candidatus Krumholzibacteria bacterium]